MDGLPENLNRYDLVYFKYVSMNFVVIERSFTMYKVLLADNNQSFEKNLLLSPHKLTHIYSTKLQ